MALITVNVINIIRDYLLTVIILLPFIRDNLPIIVIYYDPKFYYDSLNSSTPTDVIGNYNTLVIVIFDSMNVLVF